jgi:putative DNA primase/helicase
MGFRAGGDSEQNDRALRLIGYLRRLFGCALGGKPEKIVAILHGNGNNGKTTLLETIRAVLGGRQYAGQIQIESLMVKPGDASASNAINADLADLQGCRFVSASEPEKGMRFSAARVKYLTGLTEVKARYLRENPFTFQPTHKLFVDANDRPAVADPNDALWNRLKLIPFTVEIPTSEIDTSMGDKLLRERPGIMTWLVGGAMEYFAEGLQDIPEVSAATNEYRQESDRLRDFLADECTVGVGWVAVADLWTAYLDWERRNGVLVPLRKSDFDQRIQRLNCTPTKKHRGTVRAWAGISLRVGTDVTPEPHGGGD